MTSQQRWTIERFATIFTREHRSDSALLDDGSLFAKRIVHHHHFLGVHDGRRGLQSGQRIAIGVQRQLDVAVERELLADGCAAGLCVGQAGVNAVGQGDQGVGGCLGR